MANTLVNLQTKSKNRLEKLITYLKIDSIQTYGFFITIFIVIFLMFIPDFLGNMWDASIEKHPAFCKGVVVKTGKSRGPYIVYRYNVNNEEYSGLNSYGYKIKMHVGDSLLIKYDTTDPKNHFIEQYIIKQ